MNKNPVVVGIGELLWDELPSGRRMGGAPANFAIHARSLGADGVVASCVGDDEAGREILGLLRGASVDIQYVAVDVAHPTGKVTVDVDERGDPVYTFHKDAAWDHIPASSRLDALAARADAVYFGTLAQRSKTSRETVETFLCAVPDKALRIFDVNLRWPFYDRGVIESSLEVANVLKINSEELDLLADLFAPELDRSRVPAELARVFDLKLVAVTLGSKGSILCRGGALYRHPGFVVDVVDTVGAGDAFAASLAVGMLEGRDVEQLNVDANRAAAYVCTQPGATPDLSNM